MLSCTYSIAQARGGLVTAAFDAAFAHEWLRSDLVKVARKILDPTQLGGLVWLGFCAIGIESTLVLSSSWGHASAMLQARQSCSYAEEPGKDYAAYVPRSDP